ncbi:MAG: alpha-glucosidase C-terminal domain-containing protein [Muribaculaceae bacterium]|nr:alpha-glucosidase C-terminal domain-containing protein [Muribaculaceae bacterium]
MKLKEKIIMGAVAMAVTTSVATAAVTQLKEERVPENRVIYEVFVRNFSPEGNLKGVEAQIPRLKELGVDVVWLMPIYKLGDVGKWGTYSSPYAIKNYRMIDPDNGTEEDLRDLVKTIHDNGMEIWFDWVGNHTAMDNIWVESHPEYYSQKDGDFVHPFNGMWKDVYELDRDSEAMQDAMVSDMQYWVDNFDIDGYRCDYASGPSPELWRKASERVLKDGKRVAWLAEDSNRPSLVKNGYFDYNYCWDFQEKVLKKFANDSVPSLDKLRKACELLANEGITEGESKAPDDTIKAPYAGRSRMVYLVNHDVLQDQGGSEDLVYKQYLRPLTVLEFTVYGMPLIYNGQEIQYKSGGRVSLAEKTPIDWSNPDEEMTELIKRLTSLKHSQPALRTGKESGKLTNLTTTADDAVYAYKRTLGEENVVVMLNFSDKDQKFKIYEGLPSGEYANILTGNEVKMGNSVEFSLPPYGASVFVKNVKNE